MNSTAAMKNREITVRISMRALSLISGRNSMIATNGIAQEPGRNSTNSRPNRGRTALNRTTGKWRSGQSAGNSTATHSDTGVSAYPRLFKLAGPKLSPLQHGVKELGAFLFQPRAAEEYLRGVRIFYLARQRPPGCGAEALALSLKRQLVM
jgi:hypothetical protein